MKRQRKQYLMVVAVICLLAALGILFVHGSGIARSALNIAVVAIVSVLLYLIAHVLIEGGVLLALVAAFKLVTLGQVKTHFLYPDQIFPWHGFAKNQDGHWVASENAMGFVGFAVYLCLGAAAYALWV